MNEQIKKRRKIKRKEGRRKIKWIDGLGMFVVPTTWQYI